MIGLANIPMIVLFGPTNSKKFAPKNNFTTILDSKEMYNSNDIDSISVDDVFSKIWFKVNPLIYQKTYLLNLTDY